MRLEQSLLEAALIGYRRQRDEIDAKIAEIQQQLAPALVSPITDDAAPRRTMSAAARRRIAAAQKKRWAAYHQKTFMPAKKAPAKKRQLSPAAIKRISEATKKRWAAYRAQKSAAAV